MPDGRVTARRGQRAKGSVGSEIRETGTAAEWPALPFRHLIGRNHPWFRGSTAPVTLRQG